MKKINEKKSFKKMIAMAITVAMVLGMSVTPTFAATSLPKTSITAASVYYNNNAKITWKKVSGAVKYQVYRKRADQSSYKLMTTTTKTFYRSEDLKYNTKYTYKIKALNKSGKGQYSAAKSITTKKSVGTPVAIQDKRNVVSSNTLSFGWNYNAPEKNVVSYTVYRRTATSNYMKLDTLQTKKIVKDTDSDNDLVLPQPTPGYPYMVFYYERDGGRFYSNVNGVKEPCALTFVDHDNDVPKAMKKKVSNQAKINKAYNTTYYYKVIATYADGSIRASKTIKLTTKGKNHYDLGARYDLWNTFY